VIYLFCEKCQLCLRVSPGSAGELDTLFGGEETYPCPRPKCTGTVEVVPLLQFSAASRLDIIDVTPHEAHAAINGLGMPGEKECSAAAVSKLLVDKRVVRVNAVQIRGSHRCVLNMLELEDGTCVYIGSSAYGATVYRVAPKHSYVEANDEGT